MSFTNEDPPKKLSKKHLNCVGDVHMVKSKKIRQSFRSLTLRKKVIHFFSGQESSQFISVVLILQNTFLGINFQTFPHLKMVKPRQGVFFFF